MGLFTDTHRYPYVLIDSYELCLLCKCDRFLREKCLYLEVSATLDKMLWVI